MILLLIILPPDILLLGQLFSHEQKFVSFGHLLKSVPVSANISNPPVSLNPGIASTSTPCILCRYALTSKRGWFLSFFFLFFLNITYSNALLIHFVNLIALL